MSFSLGLVLGGWLYDSSYYQEADFVAGER